jgi:purine-cytosine permease-like protein
VKGVIMDGVTILAENAIYELSKIQLMIIVGLFALGIVCMIIGGIHSDSALLCIIVSMIMIFAAIIYAIVMEPKTFVEYEYKVTVDETVRFNEFQEQYEVIDQEGQIYTVVERDQE